MNPALILGLSPTGLHAVRQLSTLHVPIYGISRGKQAASCSKYLKSTFNISPSNCNEIIEKIIRIYDIEGKKVVLLPTSDDYIRFIISNIGLILKYSILPSSYINGVSNHLSDKAKFYNLCNSLGVKHANFMICGAFEFDKFVHEMTLPIIVKPIHSHTLKQIFHGNKTLIVKNTHDIINLSNKFKNIQDRVILQEIIPGPDNNITLYATYIDEQGNFTQEFTGRKIRQYPPGFGSASLAKSCSDEYVQKTKQISRKILSSINYHGIAATEFKIDQRDNSLKVIEINARPGLWFELSSASGIKIVNAYYSSLVGAPFSFCSNQIDNIYWRYSIKDYLSSVLYFFKNDKIIESPTVKIKDCVKFVHPVFSFIDFKPFVCEVIRNVRSILGIK